MAKILFFGDKSVGNGILEYLKTTDEVIGVITNPHDEKTTWYPVLKELKTRKKPDWIVCAYYDKIIPDKILKQARYGAVNVHLGLVQNYRGCYPTTLPIIDDRKVAGITIHELTSKVDGGNVYAQAKVSVDDYDTGKTLYYKCTGAAIALFIRHWKRIKEKILKPQPHKLSPKYHKRSEFPSHEIKLSWSPEKIDRYVRALTFPPFPRPYFVINGKKFEIHYG